jgi:hypothetical protein
VAQTAPEMAAFSGTTGYTKVSAAWLNTGNSDSCGLAHHVDDLCARS